MSIRAVLVTLALIGPLVGDAAGGGFRAGAAAVDVSPRGLTKERPAIVAGGFLEARSDRVHDPLFVKAIVLEDGVGPAAEPVRIACVVVDSCMLPRPLLDDAKARAAARCGIPARQILISATHTHSAPAAMGCLGTSVDEPYAERLPGAIADAIVAASDRLEPACLGCGSIDAWEHTHNRRWVRRPETRIGDPFGNPSCLANMHPGHLSKDVIGPSGPVDPQLTVVSIRTAAGRPLAVFANYSQHYFGAPAVSADYFAHFARSVAGALGEEGDGHAGFVCLLSQGTSGDLMWMDYGAAARRISIHDYAAGVARDAVEVIGRIEHRPDVTLAMVEKELTLDYRVPDESRLAWARSISAAMAGPVPRNIPEVYAREALFLHERRRTSLLVQAIRIGDATIAALPNEVFAITGLKLRARSPAAIHCNVELANGAEGYIPPPEQHVLGGYTTWPARTAGLEVAAEPAIVEALVAALEEVTGRPRRRPVDPGGAAAEAVLAAGPIGYWRCDDDEGTGLRNAVVGGQPAPLSPGFAWHLPGVGAGSGVGETSRLVSGPFARDGRVNRAVHLAGGAVRLPGEPPAGDATLVVWIWLGEPSGASARQGEVCRGLTATPLVARQDAAHEVGFTFADPPPASGLRADHWHQVAIVRRGDDATVHVDGAATPHVRAAAGREAIVIGAGLQGKLDEVALFDRPLSVEEIAALWSAGSGGR